MPKHGILTGHLSNTINQNSIDLAYIHTYIHTQLQTNALNGKDLLLLLYKPTINNFVLMYNSLHITLFSMNVARHKLTGSDE